MKKIKLAIISAVWKRPEVFEMFAHGIHALKKIPELDITVVISGSEGTESKKMVEKHGFTYIEIPNQPLAIKVNAPLVLLQKTDIEFVLCVGSDDIISPELMGIYIQAMRKKADYIGVTDFYFYDIATKKAAYWGGYLEPYRKGITAGAGRILSRRILESWQWSIWETKHNHILDNSIDEKLKSMTYSRCVFSLKEQGVYAVDVKSSTNMTPFNLWPNTTYIDASVLTEKFPMLCAESQS